MVYVLVGALGGLGSIFRFYLNDKITHSFFPVSTLLVNVVGSFLIGYLFYLLSEERFVLSEQAHIALMAGVLGGLTTFSGFSLDTIKLFQGGYILYGFLNILSNVGLCLLFCYIGVKVSESF